MLPLPATRHSRLRMQIGPLHHHCSSPQNFVESFHTPMPFSRLSARYLKPTNGSTGILGSHALLSLPTLQVHDRLWLEGQCSSRCNRGHAMLAWMVNTPRYAFRAAACCSAASALPLRACFACCCVRPNRVAMFITSYGPLRGAKAECLQGLVPLPCWLGQTGRQTDRQLTESPKSSGGAANCSEAQVQELTAEAAP